MLSFDLLDVTGKAKFVNSFIGQRPIQRKGLEKNFLTDRNI